MRDVIDEAQSWWRAGSAFALATVVATRMSAPRDPGATMAVSVQGKVAGSLSGGCVEGAVFQVARRVLDTGTAELTSFGITDEEAFSVGMTCGGELDVLIERIDSARAPFLGDVMDSIEGVEPVATATVIGGDHSGAKLAVWADRTAGTLGSDWLDGVATDHARSFFDTGEATVHRYPAKPHRGDAEVQVFLSVHVPKPQLLVFGATDFAAAVADVGSFLGFRVTVCDARRTLVTRERFPSADSIVVDWPHRYLRRCEIDQRTVICVLTHDPKFDVPALEVALRSDAAYIGAIGSRRAHDNRIARLRDAGLTADELRRLRSPIGIDIGARTPSEVAVAIAAEIISERWGDRIAA